MFLNNMWNLTAISVLLSGMHGQPPPLLKPSASQAQRHPPPLQPQGGVPRSNQGGLQGPPPLIKPMVRPIQPQVSRHTYMNVEAHAALFSVIYCEILLSP